MSLFILIDVNVQQIFCNRLKSHDKLMGQEKGQNIHSRDKKPHNNLQFYTVNREVHSKLRKFLKIKITLK